MKKQAFSICLFIVFFLVADSSAKITSQPTNKLEIRTDPKAEDVLKKMEVVGRDLNSLVANIWQQKKNTQIKGMIIDDPIETGILYYSPSKNEGMKLRIDINLPVKKTVIITRDEIKFYQPNIKNMLVTPLKGVKNSQSFGSFAITFGSVSAIKENYEVKFIREEKIEGEQTSLLHLTPKKSTPYQFIDIWVSHNLWLPVQENLVEISGDVVTIKLSNLQKNKNFNVKDLIEKFTPPKGTEIVGNNK